MSQEIAFPEVESSFSFLRVGPVFRTLLCVLQHSIAFGEVCCLRGGRRTHNGRSVALKRMCVFSCPSNVHALLFSTSGVRVGGVAAYIEYFSTFLCFLPSSAGPVFRTLLCGRGIALGGKDLFSFGPFACSSSLGNWPVSTEGVRARTGEDITSY